MKNLKNCIEKNGISRKDIQRIIGISQKQLYNYEHGLSEATESKIIALARLLHVSADYLLGLNEENER